MLVTWQFHNWYSHPSWCRCVIGQLAHMCICCCHAFHQVHYSSIFFFLNEMCNQWLVCFSSLSQFRLIGNRMVCCTVCYHTNDSQIRLELHSCLILWPTDLITNQIGLDSVLLPLLTSFMLWSQDALKNWSSCLLQFQSTP